MKSQTNPMLIKPADALTAKEQELQKQLDEIKRKKEEAEKELRSSNFNLVGRCYKVAHPQPEGYFEYYKLCSYNEREELFEGLVLNSHSIGYEPIGMWEIKDRILIEFEEFEHEFERLGSYYNHKVFGDRAVCSNCQSVTKGLEGDMLKCLKCGHEGVATKPEK